MARSAVPSAAALSRSRRFSLACIRPFLLQHCLQVGFLLFRSVQGILLILKFRLHTCQNLKIALLLIGQSSPMLRFELPDLRVLRGEAGTRVLQLLLQELRRPLRLLLPYLGVFS